MKGVKSENAFEIIVDVNLIFNILTIASDILYDLHNHTHPIHSGYLIVMMPKKKKKNTEKNRPLCHILLDYFITRLSSKNLHLKQNQGGLFFSVFSITTRPIKYP